LFCSVLIGGVHRPVFDPLFGRFGDVGECIKVENMLIQILINIVMFNSPRYSTLTSFSMI